VFTECIKTDTKAKTMRIQITRKQQTASVSILFSYVDTVNVKKGVIKYSDTLGSDLKMRL